MTAAFFRGRRRRAAAATGAVTFALVALSACDKPTPLTTVTVGTSEVHSQAACYDGKAGIDEKDFGDCLQGDGKTIKATVDDNIHFGVDPKIAKKGWTIVVGSQRGLGKSTKTYRTVPAGTILQASRTGEVKVSIVMFGDGKTYGVWNYTLKDNS
ncbi:DUF2771 domain-containing protein [Streptomyces sp. I05A-00742]|uniref:DUF2771 domain-containing protein n=1 Tax=Streptomyces sp. I05A-00742 TaxID=2732853 RepID=UPI001489B900|nr:DUF2771 domain-containing protein [Streptomyces sp. I05A-00742]